MKNIGARKNGTHEGGRHAYLSLSRASCSFSSLYFSCYSGYLFIAIGLNNRDLISLNIDVLDVTVALGGLCCFFSTCSGVMRRYQVKVQGQNKRYPICNEEELKLSQQGDYHTLGSLMFFLHKVSTCRCRGNLRFPKINEIEAFSFPNVVLPNCPNLSLSSEISEPCSSVEFCGLSPKAFE